MPGYKNCFAVTKKVWVMVVNKIATKECSSGAKKQISQGFGVMAGTHSILNVKPTYTDVNGNIYQDQRLYHHLIIQRYGNIILILLFL